MCESSFEEKTITTQNTHKIKDTSRDNPNIIRFPIKIQSCRNLAEIQKFIEKNRKK
jgi:hypothetical protein